MNLDKTPVPHKLPFAILYAIGVVALSLTIIILWSDSVTDKKVVVPSGSTCTTSASLGVGSSGRVLVEVQLTPCDPKSSTPYEIQILEHCMNDGESSPSLCLDTYARVKHVLDPGPAPDPEVPVTPPVSKSYNVPNNNNGYAYAPKLVPSGNCQSSVSTFEHLDMFEHLDPGCQRWHSNEHIQTEGDLKQWKHPK
jgi:hypothetical protein